MSPLLGSLQVEVSWSFHEDKFLQDPEHRNRIVFLNDQMIPSTFSLSEFILFILSLPFLLFFSPFLLFYDLFLFSFSSFVVSSLSPSNPNSPPLPLLLRSRPSLLFSFLSSSSSSSSLEQERRRLKTSSFVLVLLLQFLLFSYSSFFSLNFSSFVLQATSPTSSLFFLSFCYTSFRYPALLLYPSFLLMISPHSSFFSLPPLPSSFSSFSITLNLFLPLFVP